MLVRALYIQSDLRKDTENWFSTLQKALSVSPFICLLTDFLFLIFIFCFVMLTKNLLLWSLERGPKQRDMVFTLLAGRRIYWWQK